VSALCFGASSRRLNTYGIAARRWEPTIRDSIQRSACFVTSAYIDTHILALCLGTSLLPRLPPPPDQFSQQSHLIRRDPHWYPSFLLIFSSHCFQQPSLFSLSGSLRPGGGPLFVFAGHSAESFEGSAFLSMGRPVGGLTVLDHAFGRD
jgi:hypothetical protein